MALEYTEEKLNSLDKETVIQLFLSQQDQLKQIDQTLQLVLEQVADLKRHRFGKSSERHETEAQISFMEVKSGIGSAKGWGKLKSGAGWIALDYAARI